MWQRIQTVYLGLALVLMVLVDFLSLAEVLASGDNIAVSIKGYVNNGVTENADHLFFKYGWILSIVVKVFILGAILSFKNLKRQLTLVGISFALVLLFCANMLSGIRSVGAILSLGDEAIVYQAGTYFPVAAVAFLILAIRGIRKDNALLKSVDRIR